MPCAAGVGYGHSACQRHPIMGPNAGMLRLVMGLGAKAVDRTQEDDPRPANPDRPAITVYTTAAQKHRFSQRNIDVPDCRENRFREVRMERLPGALPLWYNQMMEHDYETKSRLREVGQGREVWFVSCQQRLENTAFSPPRGPAGRFGAGDSC